MFCGLHGFTCVENQTLAFLRERGMDIRPLYRDAAAPLGALHDAFVRRGERPEAFCPATRVQDLAKARGIISLALSMEPDAGPAWGAAMDGDCDVAILVRVKPEFTKSALHARGLREDHYVLARSANKRLMLLNDIPDLSLLVTREAFEAAYGGGYFTLAALRPLDGGDRQWLWDTREHRAESFVEFACPPEDACPGDGAASRLRDIAGACKVLRKRAAEYYGLYVDTGFILEAMPEYERAHAALEYCCLKPGLPHERTRAELARLIETDNATMAKLKTALGGSGENPQPRPEQKGGDTA